MAIYFVDPAAAGANNGTSWANAWTGMATARAAYTTPTPGDEFKVAYTLNETLAAAMAFAPNGSGSNRGIRFTSTDPANDAYRAGAKLVTAGYTLDLFGLVEGFTLDGSTSAAHLNVRPGNGAEFFDCTFVKQPGYSFQIAGTSNQRGAVRQCLFDQGAGYTAPCFTTNTGFVDLELFNCVMGGTIGATASLVAQTTSSASGRFRFVNCDLHGFTSILDQAAGSANGTLDVRIEGGLEPASFEAEAGNGDLLLRKGSRLVMIGSGNGTLAAPVTKRTYWEHFGKAGIQSTVYRSGGGHDGTTPQAWAVSAWANRTWPRSRHGIIVPVVSGGWAAKDRVTTARIFFAHSGAALTNDDLSFRPYTPSNATPPTALLFTANAGGLRGAAAAAYPTDAASTWGGGPTVKQYADVEFTPTISGPVAGEVMFHPGGASDRTIYLDAQIVLI
jgi:hypothetical protein